MLTKDRISGLFFLAISIAYGALAFEIRRMPFGAMEVFTPRTMPFGLSILGIVISTAIILKPAPGDAAAPVRWLGFAWHRVILLALDMVAYAYLITRIGFMPSTTSCTSVAHIIASHEQSLSMKVITMSGVVQ